MKDIIINPSRKKIVVGLSGGVDSSVAAYLLKEADCDVTGVFMRNWNEENGPCPAAEDYEDAKSVALKLNIPFYSVDFSKEYYDDVFKIFLSEYALGRTPNPDILCNREIKFNCFASFAQKEFDCEAVATGHYAKVVNYLSPNGVFQPDAVKTDCAVHLYKANDKNKDQSYFLSALSAKQLANAVFPLSDIEKPKVRSIAEKLGLRTAKKKDSTGICFIGERNFRSFLKQYFHDNPGKMIDADTGKVLGEHIGLMYYTIGQRRGLNIGGCGTGERWFVVEKDIKENILYVVQGEDNPKNFALGFTSNHLSFINPLKDGSYKLSLKYRYRQEDIPCSVEITDNGTNCTVIFDKADRGVACGQSGVFYFNNECLGQAVIDEVIKN